MKGFGAALVIAAVAGFVGCAAIPLSTTHPVVAPSARPAQDLHWSLTLRADRSLDSRICDATGAPLDDDDLADIGPVDSRARAFAQPPTLVDGCLQVRIDLAAAATALGVRSGARWVAGDVVVASPDIWLWTRARPVGGVMTLRTSSRSTRAVVPLSVREDAVVDDDAEDYIVDVSTWRLSSCAVFGDVSVRLVHGGGSTFSLVTLPGQRQMTDDEVERWLHAAIGAVATGTGSRGRLPFSHATIVVEPVAGDGVPFGMVMRGGGLLVWLLLGQQARLDGVVDDWVAVHEFSHLLQPLVALDDVWFGEGLATWHQIVLRARAGLVSETEAWAALHDGLNRGAASVDEGARLSLRQASASMRRDGRYQQTYWGGAAIIFVVDAALWRCARRGIDDVVAAVFARHAASERIPARAILLEAAQAAPACRHIPDDVEAMLQEPFPRAGVALRDAMQARDPAVAAHLAAALRPRAPSL